MNETNGRKRRPVSVADLRDVSATVAGRIFGVSRQTIVRWCDIHGAPRNPDNSFNLEELVQWRIGYLLKDEDVLMSSGSSSPALERFRSLRADLVELELKKARGLLVKRTVLREALRVIATHWRRACEDADRRFSADVFEMLSERLNQMERDLRRVFPMPTAKEKKK